MNNTVHCEETVGKETYVVENGSCCSIMSTEDGSWTAIDAELNNNLGSVSSCSSHGQVFMDENLKNRWSDGEHSNTTDSWNVRPLSPIVSPVAGCQENSTSSIIANVRILKERLEKEKDRLVRIRDHQVKVKAQNDEMVSRATGKLEYVKSNIRDRIQEI